MKVKGILTVALTALVVGSAAPASAAGPAVQYVEASTLSDSSSPKMARAQCPAGKAVLGGAANVSGAEGQVAIQAAFPEFDPGLGKFVYVVKAVEDPDGTAKSWRLTAGAYCTDATVPEYPVPGSSAFNSNDVKQASVSCPEGKKVVGMGGLVTTADLDDPAATVGDVPPATVVFEGFEVNDDLTEVTAYASELNAGLGGAFFGSWKVMAVVSCAYEHAVAGLELRDTTRPLGIKEHPDSSMWGIACSPGKRNIAAGARIKDFEMGNWYLDRFSRQNALQTMIYSESFRNPESGSHTSFEHTVQTICVG